MHKLTSNFTIFWKIFFPVLFLTIMYLFGFVMLFTDNDAFFLFSNTYAKIGYWTVMIVICLIFYFTILNIKRVEFDEDHFYISNYFKTIKIPKEGITQIKIRTLPIFSRMKLVNKGTFGQTITFIPDRVGVEALKTNHKDLMS